MVHRVDLDPAQLRPGSTLRPIARFEAGPASAVLGRAEIFEREPLEFAVARLAWDGDPKAAAAVVTAAADAVEGPVYLPVNALTAEDHAARGELARACGFELFQEKEALWWVDTGQPLPDPGLRFVPLSVLGRAAFVPVIARCVARTLDRTDALVVARHGAEEWASTFLDRSATGADAESWLLASDSDGVVGFVGLAERGPAVGTVVLIGVLPEHRGRRHVDPLLRAAYLAARGRGFTTVQSLVDVDNHPMMAAARRSGADPNATPWHKWLYVRAS